MKGILVILDGMADLACKQLNGKTPLEAANTSNLDFFSARGEMGYMYTVKPGFIPESDEAIVSIFGNEFISSTRGQLEARGVEGLELKRGDLALRANFGTIDSFEKGNIIDRRAGRTLTNWEAETLSKAINNQLKLSCKFELKSTVQHRGVLVFRGGFSDNIFGNDATYTQGKNKGITKISYVKSLDDSENSQYTANIVNEFIKKSYEILDKHPINEVRRKKGLLPANYIFLRGPGIEKPKLKIYKKWISIGYMPLEKGFSKVSGMHVSSFNYPPLKKLDVYDNLYSGLRKACKYSIKMIKKNRKKFDYAYIHIKETDLPGHDNKPLVKKDMIEYVDKTLFKFLRNFAPQNKIKIVVTADHSTPCKLKNHSADPVPVLFYSPPAGRVPKEKKFSEKEARKGSLKSIIGKDLLKVVGFDR